MSSAGLSRLAFWSSAAVAAGTYVGFPLAMLAKARWAPRPFETGDITPSIAVVIAAHNEEGGLGAKLRSVLDCDYPPHLRDVVVASDGSTDNTADVVRSFAAEGVRLLDLSRGGKAAALNAALRTVVADVVVFSDANNPLDVRALREIVRPFADPEIGGVAGDQRYVASLDDIESAGERSYWAIDRMLKNAESAGGSVTSATGALYAVRRQLVPTVVEGVTDDFWVSTNVVVAGSRLVHSEAAKVYEVPAAGAGPEFQRKVRVMTRGLRGVYERRELLDPRKHGLYSVQLWCHKVLRRLMALPVVVMWLSSVVAARRGGPFWRAVAASQTVGYVVGAAGLGVRVPGPLGRVVSLASYFVMVNAASVVAVWNVLRGHRITVWQPAREEIDAP